MSEGTTKRVLLLASNPATPPVTSWPIGFWWTELSHAWLSFNEAGYDITVVSPDGGDLEADMWSDPEHEAGYSAHDIISLGFKHGAMTAPLLENTPALKDLDLATLDAVFVAGGQAPMVTMVDNEYLQMQLAGYYESGGLLAAVCHATCLPLKMKLSNGDLLVKGKTWTGFANSEERYSESASGQKIQPFWIEDEARKIEDTNFITGGHLVPFAIRDGNLITGQQQLSAGVAAEKVVEVLGA